jgi:hypothetical protein
MFSLKIETARSIILLRLILEIYVNTIYIHTDQHLFFTFYNHLNLREGNLLSNIDLIFNCFILWIC